MRIVIMKQVFFGLLVTIWLSSSLSAEAYEYEQLSCSTTNNCFAGYESACQQSPWSLSGHVESGLYVNQYGQKNAYTGRALRNGGVDANSGNTDLLLNVGQSDLQLSQGWIILEKKLSKRSSWDVGGRVDYVFGTDARYMQSSGLEKDAGHAYWGTGDYYSSIAQAYAEFGYGNLRKSLQKEFCIEKVGVNGLA